MTSPDPASERTARFLIRLAAWLTLIYLGLGICFVFHYQSADATWGPWTPRYVLGVIAPFLLACGAGVLLVRAQVSRSGWIGDLVGRLPGWLAGVLALGAIGAGAAYALSIADQRISIYMLILPAPLLLLAWACASGRVDALLPGCILLAAGVCLFGSELPDLLSGSPLVEWGTDNTFAYMFPTQPPFIGGGGRLRPNLYARMKAAEYPGGARLITNSEGFRNVEEFPSVPRAGEGRIMSLGDSFSTGFCVDQEAFFGALLQKELGVEVLNAEVSDPAYGLYYLQHHGMSFHPEIIMYGMSGNDLMQAEQFYGGDRLFRLDSRGRLEPNVAFNPAVKFSWVRFPDFAYPEPGRPPGQLELRPALTLVENLSRFRAFGWLASRRARQAVPMPGYADELQAPDGRLRLIDGGANLGFFYLRDQRPVDLMYEAGFAMLEAMRRTAEQGGAKFLLVVHPQRYQVQPADWDAMRVRWNLDDADFDLTLANRRIAEMAAARGIEVLDLREAFAREAPAGQLYLPGGDTHYNRRGHQVAAAAAAAGVRLALTRP